MIVIIKKSNTKETDIKIYLSLFILKKINKLCVHIKFTFDLLTNIGLSHIILKLIKCKSI